MFLWVQDVGRLPAGDDGLAVPKSRAPAGETAVRFWP